MNSVIVFIVGVSMVCCVMGYPQGGRGFEEELLVEDEFGQQYQLVPVGNRNKRESENPAESSLGVNSRGELDLAHKGNLWENNHHAIDGTAFVAKDFKGGPMTTGETIDYTNKQSNHGFSLTHSNTRGYGDDINAAAKYNVFTSPDRKTTAGFSAEYNRHFGGPGGTGQPNYGAFFRAQHNF